MSLTHLTSSSYFDAVERIAQPDYLPTDQDVLRSRVKTTGITETTFIIGDLTYRMFDVGGQRSERKKWIHCFENVTTILFLVAISEYDQLLFEDETVNRMQEALTLFDSICNSRWFVKTSIILFLNKIDRFKEKLPVSPMKNYFPDYEGGADYAAACDYILNRFVSLNQAEQKQIYTHFTCATDTTQIRFVMAAVNGMLLSFLIPKFIPVLTPFHQISSFKRTSDSAVSSNDLNMELRMSRHLDRYPTWLVIRYQCFLFCLDALVISCRHFFSFLCYFDPGVETFPSSTY